MRALDEMMIAAGQMFWRATYAKHPGDDAHAWREIYRVDVDPYDIPNGYDIEQHRALVSTIAEPGDLRGSATAMACHETDNAHCVGWLMNQVGPGNNIGLRLRLMSCENARSIRVHGEQHETFQDTLPKRRRKRA